jgi:hypothetical protein
MKKQHAPDPIQLAWMVKQILGYRAGGTHLIHHPAKLDGVFA